MTDRLSIYNDALLLIGERALSSLTESREPRRLLDQVWNNDGVNHCLEKGQWFFAMRAIKIDYDPGIDPGFGYRRAFAKPSDWVLTSGLCSDEWFRVPLTQYNDEADYWYADEDVLYVRYVSNDSGYGNNLSRWPASFKEFVAAHFASRVALKITGDKAKANEIFGLRKMLLNEAKNNAAMALPTSFPARGSWSNARTRHGRNRDGGSNTNLIG
jgi:uncharacterized protein YneR